MQSILQLVPSLPPETGGVGDYALTLANELSRSHAISTSFLVGKPSWQGAAQLDGFPVARVQSRTAENLAHAIEQSAVSVVLLQLSGYGYDPNGCPAWVADGLRLWKAKSGGRLVTMFHELYASGPPWRKAFWLKWKQQSIVEQIAELSDGAVTNLARYRGSIEQFDERKKGRVPTLPVFSNIGEPSIVPPLRSRVKRMVVFGSAATRSRAYGQGQRALLRTCQSIGLTEIVDVGPELQQLPPQIGNVPVRQMGILKPEAASALMLDSVAGFLDYFVSYLAKSSVFAAYAVHGMLPVTLNESGSEEDGLRAGGNYWIGDQLGLSEANAQSIANVALNWYREHSLTAHAFTFASLLKPASPALQPSTSMAEQHARCVETRS